MSSGANFWPSSPIVSISVKPGKLSETAEGTNVRCFFAYMFAHPGKKTMFMSMEFAQWREWNVWGDLEWHLLQYDKHRELKEFFKELNSIYRQEPSLYSMDFEPEGFEWIDCSDNRHSVISFIRYSKEKGEFVVVVCNFTPQPHSHYRIGVPEAGFYSEIFNSDARNYGGCNMGNLGGKYTEEWSFHGHPYSLDLCLPPLGVLMFKIKPEAIGSKKLEEDKKVSQDSMQ
jgi:1,4-alpha-glucan branching enzyme